MKKINKIKLTVLSHNEIADREQRLLKGGDEKLCGCASICLEDLCGCIKTSEELVLDSGYYLNSSDNSEQTTNNVGYINKRIQ